MYVNPSDEQTTRSSLPSQVISSFEIANKFPFTSSDHRILLQSNNTILPSTVHMATWLENFLLTSLEELSPLEERAMMSVGTAGFPNDKSGISNTDSSVSSLSPES